MWSLKAEDDRTFKAKTLSCCRFFHLFVVHFKENNARRSNLEVLRKGLVEWSLHVSIQCKAWVDCFSHGQYIFLCSRLSVEGTHSSLNKLFNGWNWGIWIFNVESGLYNLPRLVFKMKWRSFWNLKLIKSVAKWSSGSDRRLTWHDLYIIFIGSTLTLLNLFVAFSLYPNQALLASLSLRTSFIEYYNSRETFVSWIAGVL